MAEDDLAIVEAVRSGETEGFRLLVDRHKDRLHAVILRLVGDRSVAEELAQETFVRAFRALRDFRGEASFGTWLVQIGIHAARDRMRSGRRHALLSLDQPRGGGPSALELVDRSPAADPGHAVEAREDRQLLRSALASLPPEYREVLVLKHFEGWPYAEIAGLTGDSVGTLKVRAFRARLLLRERLKELGWDPGADHASGHGPGGES